ncbi:plasmid mobilization protein [Rhodoblastus sp.]|uniref:plasmid mobilization protein n=1 Tax=Rhodoblastus sp. TaxID=1962975 RepID=UPI003F95FA19
MDHKYASETSRDDGEVDKGGYLGRSTAGRRSLSRQPLSVRLSEQELRSVVAAATVCGRRPSVFVRIAALSAAGRPVSATAARRDALAQETAKAVGHLGRIGSLLNQIARVANSTGRINASDAAYTYERAAREIAAIRQALLTQNGDGHEP